MAPPGDINTLTPSDLNRRVRSLLESHFDFVWVEGEISNFARPSSGHWYFSLKDDNAQVRCAMFRNRNQRLRFTPGNGDQVRLRARVSLYEGRGEFQLVGEFMEPAGAGALQARFEALRDRLRAEGLFDSARKNPLPESPQHLAVITSPTGAALQDVLHVLERRNPSIRITVFPCPVQGDDAAPALTGAVVLANELAQRGSQSAGIDSDFDAILLTRGGGSLEDLWAFNDEALARAIADSELPVVTGVGHEVDFTIADFASDARAPTPSAAAELLSTDLAEELRVLNAYRQRMTTLLRGRIERESLRLEALRGRLRHPGERLREQSQRLDRLEMDLRRAMESRLSDCRQALQRRADRLSAVAPGPRLERTRERLLQQRQSLENGIRRLLMTQRQNLESREQLLRSLSPLAILDRGYAVVSDEQGRIIREGGTVTVGQALRARLARGSLSVEVTGTNPEE